MKGGGVLLKTNPRCTLWRRDEQIRVLPNLQKWFHPEELEKLVEEFFGIWDTNTSTKNPVRLVMGEKKTGDIFFVFDSTFLFICEACVCCLGFQKLPQCHSLTGAHVSEPNYIHSITIQISITIKNSKDLWYVIFQNWAHNPWLCSHCKNVILLHEAVLILKLICLISNIDPNRSHPWTAHIK